jgi:hypothetical protein
MKGLFFQQQLEFRLDVPGDSFLQGASIPCSLKVRNHGETPAVIATPTLWLAVGNLKKVKAKDPSAFEVAARAELEAGVAIAPKSEYDYSHSFLSDHNFSITDKSVSPYLLYGNSVNIAELGQLLVTFTLHPHVSAIFDTFTTVFSFVSKGISWKDGWTTAKLKAPDSARMSFVDELAFSARLEGDLIRLRYVFTVKKFDTSTTTVGVKKGKTEVSQTWPSSEYLFGGGFVQQQYVESMIEGALAEVSSGF